MRVYELSHRSRKDAREERYAVHCDKCGFLIRTDRDIAEFVAGAHTRDPECTRHKTKVVKA